MIGVSVLSELNLKKNVRTFLPQRQSKLSVIMMCPYKARGLTVVSFARLILWCQERIKLLLSWWCKLIVLERFSYDLEKWFR